LRSKNPKQRKGFTLIEVLVDLMIISFVATAIIAAFMAGYNALSLSKAKISAVALANEKMEELRNMPYDDLATENGGIYPPGELLDNEEVVRKNIRFNVHMTLSYVDDPFDGDALGSIPGKPVDIYPYDYKKARIEIYKIGREPVLADISTNISAKAAETPSDTGILYLCVIDAENQPVAEATVTIVNTEVTPPVNMELETDESGCVMIPALPPDEHNNYHLVITKDGYSTDMTYPRTAQNPNQIQPDVNISVQQVTKVTLAIDKVSTLQINTVDLAGAPVPNLSLHIEDSKEIQFNPTTYKYSEDHSCDAFGQLTLTDMEWGDYKISINTDGYWVSSTFPVLPVHLSPDTALTVTVYVTDSGTAPRITAVDPNQGIITDITSIIVDGENFDNSAGMKLVNSGSGAEIIGTNVEVHAHQEIVADFDLSTGSLGFWDLVITNPGGEYARQYNAIEIVEE
jgi:prepilin-type N-terminal cleavage/methylation domain-containing protein